VTINMAASTVGQLAMSVTGTHGYVPFVIGAIAFICAILPSAMTSTPQPRPLKSARLDVKLLYKTSPLAVIASFACGMANGSFGTLAPVYGYQTGLDAAGIALLFAVTAILGAVAQIPAGRLSDKIDRRLVIVFLSGGAAAIGLLTVLAGSVGLLSGGSVLTFVFFALYGFAANPLYAIAVAHANDFAKDGEFARVAGGMLLILGTGLAIGPILASWVMQNVAPVGLFIVTATFHGALAVTAFLRMKVRPVRDAKGRVRFRAMNAEKGVTPGSVDLDPRSEESQENLPRSAATSRPHEAEILVPDPLNPSVIVEDVPKTTPVETTAPAMEEAPATETAKPAAKTKKTDTNVQE
jgi:hypothetical protein